MKLPTLEQARAWAESQARILAKQPRNREAQYLLVLLHHIKSLEREKECQKTPGRVIDI